MGGLGGYCSTALAGSRIVVSIRRDESSADYHYGEGLGPDGDLLLGDESAQNRAIPGSG